MGGRDGELWVIMLIMLVVTLIGVWCDMHFELQDKECFEARGVRYESRYNR